MAKNNPVPSITHCEIICYAIQTVGQKYQEAGEMLRHLGSKDPNPWQDKLEALCSLYRIETGSEFGYDFELD